MTPQDSKNFYKFPFDFSGFHMVSTNLMHFCRLWENFPQKLWKNDNDHIFLYVWNRVEIFDWEKTNYFDQNLSLNNLDRKFIA